MKNKLLILWVIAVIAGMIYIGIKINDLESKVSKQIKAVSHQVTELKPNGTHQDFITLTQAIEAYTAAVKQNTAFWEALEEGK